MFLNPNNLTDTVLNVYTDNYLSWLTAIRQHKSMETIHRYQGGMLASEKILSSVVGPNIGGQLINQRKAFIDKNYYELTGDENHE
jgi:hypothetical protein